MENKLKSDERGSLSSRRRGLTRREWVQRMLAGAAMAGPALCASPPAHAQAPTPREASAQAQPAIVPPEWKPVFSDDHQNQTVISLAERIVPGSTATQANRFLDTALAAETQEKQQRFIAALNALEGESLRRFTKPIHELSANQQDQLLGCRIHYASIQPERINRHGRSNHAGHGILRPQSAGLLRSFEAVDRHGLLLVGSRE